MTTLYRDGITEKEFTEISSIARGLLEIRRNHCIEELARIGVKAVGPILYVVECDAAHDDDDPDDYDAFNQACFEAMRRIGKPALPILERYIEKDGVHDMVNIFAQEAVFEVMGLDEEQRKKVCRHNNIMGVEKDGRMLYWCAICEQTMEEEDLE